MNKEKKDIFILILILTITFASVGFAMIFGIKDNMQTRMLNERAKAEITKIISISTEGTARDIRSFIKDELTVVVYPEVIEKNSKIIYTMNVKNTGNTDIELNGIDITPKIGNHLLYTISNISVGDVLEIGESKVFSVEISYDNDYELDSVDYKEEAVNIILDFIKK